jgi:hypothetical protein
MMDKIGEVIGAVSFVLIGAGVILMLMFDVDSSAVGSFLKQGITLVVFAGLAVGIIFAILGE